MCAERHHVGGDGRAELRFQKALDRVAVDQHVRICRSCRRRDGGNVVYRAGFVVDQHGGNKNGIRRQRFPVCVHVPYALRGRDFDDLKAQCFQMVRRFDDRRMLGLPDDDLLPRLRLFAVAAPIRARLFASVPLAVKRRFSGFVRSPDFVGQSAVRILLRASVTIFPLPARVYGERTDFRRHGASQIPFFIGGGAKRRRRAVVEIMFRHGFIFVFQNTKFWTMEDTSSRCSEKNDSAAV